MERQKASATFYKPDPFSAVPTQWMQYPEPLFLMHSSSHALHPSAPQRSATKS